MNLRPIIAKQKGLMDHIEKEHPTQPGEDRFKKRLLALAVEVGECANEWRGFKFWSKDQQPRIQRARAPYMDLDDADFYNPLLEEYVDCLHFVVDIGISIGFEFNCMEFPEGSNDIEQAFLEVFASISCLDTITDQAFFSLLFEDFIRLGAVLGFTWEEIEKAYYKKNKVNHARQESGY